MVNFKSNEVMPEKAEEQQQVGDTTVSDQQVGEGIKNKNIFLPSDKMDTTKLEKMTVNALLCHIRSNRRIKNNLSGYSKMNKAELIETLKKYHEDGEKHPRVVKETEWSKALKVFNENRETFVIPKKGSKDYEEVQKIIANGGKKVEVTMQQEKPKQKRSKVTPEQKATVATEDEPAPRKASLRQNPKRKIVFDDDE